MARVVCLANSRSHGGRCIAGIDIDTRKWVRPVNRPLPGGTDIAPGWLVSGRQPRLDEILQIPLDVGDMPDDPCQPENRYVRSNGVWLSLGQMALDEVAKYCEEGGALFYTPTSIRPEMDHVKWEHLQKVPAKHRRSLQLLRTRDAIFSITRDRLGRPKAHVKFSYGLHCYDLTVTDAEAETNITAGRRFPSTCLLAVGLAKRQILPTGGLSPNCYKLVAGVIPLR